MIPGAKSYLHCRTCLAQGRKNKERLEIAITDTGISVGCYEHGLVGSLTPEKLASMVTSAAPPCDCPNCINGRPHVN